MSYEFTTSDTPTHSATCSRCGGPVQGWMRLNYGNRRGTMRVLPTPRNKGVPGWPCSHEGAEGITTVIAERITTTERTTES